MTKITREQLAGCIDHTLLSATAVTADIEKLCSEAVEYGFHTVCVHPRWIGFVSDILRNTSVKTGGITGFPFGTETTKMKVAEVKDAIFAGADEIDIVADLAAVIEADRRYLTGQFTSISKICRSMKPAVIIKVIIESAALTDEQKIFVCRIADECGVDFVKTSTGLHKMGGATVKDVQLMKQTAKNCKVKASGGIKTANQAIEMIAAGAERIGTSSGVQIVREFDTK